jgi:alpha-galactosidase
MLLGWPHLMSAYTSRLRLDSHFSAEEFAPDGRMNKAVWRKAAWGEFDHDWRGIRRYPRSATRVASCWTERYAYFAFECPYSTLNLYNAEDTNPEKYGLWERDVVEAFLNPDPERVEHYYEFEVAPNNMWIDLEIDLNRKPFHDPAWDSHFTHATQLGKGVWTCEMRIPCSPMTSPRYKITPGVEWRGNFFRADGKGNNTKRRLLAWSPTLTAQPNFHVPERFGLIRFVK